ncbi:hypothetical protein H0H92_002132 [Tricholoma furcatifolium]|nr:hypothetical protein H0H92_002132 [Tricholoma furcatifolium]
MDGLSDDPRHLRISHVSAFDLDDAFSDGDFNEFAAQFSPEAMREDIARHMPPIDTVWGTEDPKDSNGVFKGQNLSVSTLDIEGNGSRTSSHSHSPSPSPSPPQTPHPQSPEFSDQFSQISLDNNEHDQQPPDSLEDNYTNDNVEEDAATKHTRPPVPLILEQHTEDHEPFTPQTSYSPYPPDSAQSTQSLPPHPAPQPSPAAPRPLSATPVLNVPSASTPTSEPAPNGAASSSSTASPPRSKPRPHGHRPTRSTGPSALEKVMSQTRPVFLPPKSRKEDNKHLADWQSMMKTSRTIAEKKRKALQERRLAREKDIEDSIHIWEREIVPDWRVVHRNPSLRKLWWKGIPSKLRASIWERAVGNSLSLSKDHYRICLSRAKKALNSNVFPQASLDAIEADIATTLPSLHIFRQNSGPLYEDLKEMLCAWVVARSDEGLGYTPGASRVAAMLLLNMPVQQGFVAMRNLLDRHCLRSFFGGEGARDDVEAYYRYAIVNTKNFIANDSTRIFDTLLADGMPKIYFNFKQHQILPSVYLNDWLLPLFLDHLPFEACARVWDILILEGDAFLYRASLAILAVLEPRLFFPDRKELVGLLKGENRAAIEVAKREGRSLDAGKYEIYGVDEETLWERIEQMDDWWKESTWTRLLHRELPDI